MDKKNETEHSDWQQLVLIYLPSESLVLFPTRPDGKIDWDEKGITHLCAGPFTTGKLLDRAF
jgi:hypothetical protein